MCFIFGKLTKTHTHTQANSIDMKWKKKQFFGPRHSYSVTIIISCKMLLHVRIFDNVNDDKNFFFIIAPFSNILWRYWMGWKNFFFIDANSINFVAKKREKICPFLECDYHVRVCVVYSIKSIITLTCWSIQKQISNWIDWIFFSL